MKYYGLLGFPLSHSFSVGFFTEKFKRESIDATYKNFPISSMGLFPALLKENPELSGLNVTIPYKESIIPYLDALDAQAKAVGAVNVIKFERNEKGQVNLKGYNTDIIGFRESIQPLILALKQRLTGHTDDPPLKALILGTGGASKAVNYALRELGVEPVFVSRKAAPSILAYEELTEEVLNAHRIIVNTTPLGMYPNLDGFPPLDYTCIGSCHLLYDLVYNPRMTAFMRKGVGRGALVKNGIDMLHLQAEASWAIWNSDR